MARRKYEFRPDKMGSGILNKLYITRKQWAGILKWSLYALVLLVMSVVQDVMLSRVRLFGATTDLVPCAIILICVIQGAENGSIFILVASALYLFSGSAPDHYTIAFLPILGLCAAMFRQGYLRKGFSAAFLCAGVAMMLYELAIFVGGLMMLQTTPERLRAFLLTGAYSLLAMPVLYPICTSIDRIGGETWKE